MNRGEVAVCIVGAGPDEDLRAHTPAAVPIMSVTSMADAFARADPADVVVLQPGCRVVAGWLDGLRDAAYGAGATATASPLTQHDLGLDLGAAPGTPERAAALIRSASLRIRPRIDTPAEGCVYVRRSAIELIGGGDGFWAECVARGLSHVLADDVLVMTPGPARPVDDPSPPETRAAAAARRALRGVRVTIDARILSGPTTGTHVHVLELIAGLTRTAQIRLSAILPAQPSEFALARLRALPHVSLVTYDHPPDRADIVHRPFQLSNAGDLTWLQTLGDRLVLTQQDLIAFHNPAYFATVQAWREYRQLTQAGLATADRVLFFSAHARDDALAEELVDPAHADVVRIGVDHAVESEPMPPAGAERIGERPFLLCLGTDFLHKNRPFALRLLGALRDRGSDIMLAFAGPSVVHGSSRPYEQRFLADHPHLRDHVTDLGAVGDAERDWLYEHARLVVYPSVVEGFGLVPFEAAARRAPCLWAPGSSLSELLGDGAAGIVPWDAHETASNALALLQDESARKLNLSTIDDAAAGLTWDATAERLLGAYRTAAGAPARARAGTGIVLSEDAARLVGPGGELPADVQRPLLALATHPKLARPAWSALRLGYGLLHRRK